MTDGHEPPTGDDAPMNRELFGVFGAESTLREMRPDASFDRIVTGPTVTVAIRDPAMGLPSRTEVHSDGEGLVAVFGEAFAPDGASVSPAAWLARETSERGLDALGGLNGSFVAVLDRPETTAVATDPIRSWELFSTDAPGPRVFGTDAAAVARTIDSPTVDQWPLYEFLVLGGALADRTVLTELDRLPLDAALTAGGVRELDRYHHDPRTFDYVGELAERLQRAIVRRIDGPGSTGLLLSAGLDSRTILALHDQVDRTYTLGDAGTPEATVAAEIAIGSGVDHTTLPIDERYLDRERSGVAYTNGVKESLHIHHSGYTDDIDVDAVVHGLLWDTLLTGYFLPRDGVDLLGMRIPRTGLDPDPEPVAHLAGILGYLPGSDPLIAEGPVSVDTPEAFFRETIGVALAGDLAREDDVYAGIERFGVANVLSSPFRAHLADTYREQFVAADRELIDWHLHTPPSVRTEKTLREALERIDPDILSPRPPDRPHDSFLANQVEKRLRRSVPGLTPFGSPWPDRRDAYERSGLDDTIVPDRPDLHSLPPRVKLRIDDLRRWLDRATTGAVSLEDYLPSL